tara:strand:+ start:3136 stop:5241 length:2106 start_codon:yes stop_codon:yes gene_type:complete
MNLYPESTEGEGKSDLILIGCAGTEETADYGYVAGTSEVIQVPDYSVNSFIGVDRNQPTLPTYVKAKTITTPTLFFTSLKWTPSNNPGSKDLFSLSNGVDTFLYCYLEIADMSLRFFHKNNVSNKAFTTGATSMQIGVKYSIVMNFNATTRIFEAYIDDIFYPLSNYNNYAGGTVPADVDINIGVNPNNSYQGADEIYDFYWGTSHLTPTAVTLYSEEPNGTTSNRPNYTGRELFTQVAPDALIADWYNNPTQGSIVITPAHEEIITSPATGIVGVSGTSPCRGMHYASNGILYVVYGGALIKYLPNGFSVKLMSLSENSGTRVSMTDNGFDLVLVDGAFLKTVKLDTDIVGTPTVDFANPTQVQFLGRRVLVINETDNVWYSDIDDASSWPALNVFQAETYPDNIVAFSKKDGELWLMGEQSYEVRRVDSDPNNPYSLVGGSANQIGCGAKYSLSSIADNVFWLGSSVAGQNIVYMSNGYSQRRISNHAIEWELDKYKDSTGSAFATTYQQEGHTFYILTIPSSDKTFAYDLASNMWHERSTRDALKNINHQWAVTHCAFAYGRVLCGNGEVPLLMELKLDKYDEWDSRPIVKLHQSPVYYTDYKVLYHDIFEVDIETGVGLQLGQGSKPQIMMQYSDDGGHTWSSERWVGLGSIGQYSTKAQWRRLGISRQRVYRVSISDPVKVVMIGAKLNYSVGANQ